VRREPWVGVVLALVGALLAACGGSGADSSTTVTSGSSPAEAPAEGTGRFEVRDSTIVGPDGEPFVARGVNLLGPQSFWPDETQGLSEAVVAWGLNSVRLNTCLPGGCQGADGASWPVNDDLDAIVEEFTGAGLVVIISLHQVEPGTLADDATFPLVSSWWRQTATRYADNPLVWFNLLNEPGHGDSVDVRWKTVHERLVEVVREVAPNLILLDGTQYGQEAGIDATGGESRPDTGPVTEATSAILRYGPELAALAPDVAFSVHVYDRWSEPADDDIARFERLREFVEAVHALDLALVIGETGGPADDPAGPLAAASRTAYSVAGALDLGLLAWHGQAGDDFSLLVHADGSRADLTELDTAELTWQGDLLWTLANEPEEMAP
jgi:mannan endo-1,4-beta-mannosidase